MANHKMVVLGDVRYRPEDVPQERDDVDAEATQDEGTQPKARRRTPKPKVGTDDPAA